MPEDTVHIAVDKIREALGADVLVGNGLLSEEVTGVYASDLMSDVLAFGKSGSILFTGLNTLQAAISSYMAEFKGVVFLRGKKPTSDILSFAAEKGLIILNTRLDLYEACCRISSSHDHGSATEEGVKSEPKENVATHDFTIDGRDFASAGMVSSQVKAILKSIGYDPVLIRRVAIATYEGEINVYMHAVRAKAVLKTGDNEITVTIDDEGKGIPDIELAMQPGYTTSTEEQRAKGFGSGMGLCNMKKNADVMNISSEVGKGTCVEMHFSVS